MQAASGDRSVTSSTYGGVAPLPQLASQALEEGWARLEYLVAQRRRLGLLLGPAGSGKSLLLRQFAPSARRQGAVVWQVGMLGLDASEMLGALAAQAGLRRRATEPRAGLWRAVSDRLVEQRYERRTVALLLDDADQATEEGAEVAVRLLHLAAAEGIALTAVLAARHDRRERIDSRLAELVELRIDLEPWTVAETQAYVQDRLHAKGIDAGAFEPDAVLRLHELAGGSPRKVAHLADLALVARQDRLDQPFDAAAAAAVFDELSGYSDAGPTGVP